MATEPGRKDWPWDRLGDKERRMFALVRAYMDYHNLWYSVATKEPGGVEMAVKAVAAMSDAEVEAFLEMYLLDRMVNK